MRDPRAAPRPWSCRPKQNQKTQEEKGRAMSRRVCVCVCVCAFVCACVCVFSIQQTCCSCKATRRIFLSSRVCCSSQSVSRVWFFVCLTRSRSSEIHTPDGMRARKTKYHRGTERQLFIVAFARACVRACVHVCVCVFNPIMGVSNCTKRGRGTRRWVCTYTA